MPTLLIHPVWPIPTVSQAEIKGGVAITLSKMQRVGAEWFRGLNGQASVSALGVFLLADGSNSTFSLYTNIEYAKNTDAATGLTATQDVLSAKSDVVADRTQNIKPTLSPDSNGSRSARRLQHNATERLTSRTVWRHQPPAW
jgi:hypothetical protein